MKRAMKITLLLLVLIALIIGIWYYFFRNRRDENTLTLFGNVDVRQVELGFRVFGRVVDMFFDEGDLVRKGTLMARLELQPYADQLRQAEAAESAAKATSENAERQHQRRMRLAPEGGVSIEDLESSGSTQSVDISNLRERTASAAVSKKNLVDTEVFCPNDGVVLTRVREPGTVVNVGDPIYTLSILSPVWVRAYVSETDLGKIFYGMKATIHTDAKKVYHGHIGFISPVAEFTPKTVETQQLRTSLVYRLRVIADNPDCFLKQGMPVTVFLDLTQPCPEGEQPRQDTVENGQ